MFLRQDALRAELQESLRMEQEDQQRQWSKWKDQFPVLEIEDTPFSLFQLLSGQLDSPQQEEEEAEATASSPPPPSTPSPPVAEIPPTLDVVCCALFVFLASLDPSL